jgi:hypothetical protein
MKTFFLLQLLFSIEFQYARQQTVQFEQIAFEYYLSELADKDLKGTLWTELYYFAESLFWHPRCLEDFKIESNDKVSSNVSGLSELELSPEEKRLKIKPFKKGKYPRIFSTTSFSNYPNQHFVNIVENHKDGGIIYHIEMDDQGEIVNWCQGGWIY